jgi:antitoxin component of RelBE/YafQ-DinJ toxin-antitoxin module
MGRTYMLRVKMSLEEKRTAEALASAHGLNVSAYVRMLLHEKDASIHKAGRAPRGSRSRKRVA